MTPFDFTHRFITAKYERADPYKQTILDNFMMARYFTLTISMKYIYVTHLLLIVT